MAVQFTIPVTLLPDQALQLLEGRDLAILIDPAFQLPDDRLQVDVLRRNRLFSRHQRPHLVQGTGHLGIIGPHVHEVRQARAGIGEQLVLHEGQGCGGAFDIGDDGTDHTLLPQYSSMEGKRLAMSLPVKSATQPSGVVNRRIHLKQGAEPMSNQWVVLAGTLIRSPCSHSTR